MIHREVLSFIMYAGVSPRLTACQPQGNTVLKWDAGTQIK